MVKRLRKGGNFRSILTGVGLSDSFVVPKGFKIDSITTDKIDTNAVDVTLGTTEANIETAVFTVTNVETPAVVEDGHIQVTHGCDTDGANFSIQFDTAGPAVVVPMLAGVASDLVFTVTEAVDAANDNINVRVENYESVLMTITSAETGGAGTVSINLPGLAAAVPTTLGAGDAATAVADKIFANAALFTAQGWTVTHPTATTLLFKANAEGTLVGPTVVSFATSVFTYTLSESESGGGIPTYFQAFETVRYTVTAANTAVGAGSFNVVLSGALTLPIVTAGGETINEIADLIAAPASAGWTKTAGNGVVTFTSTVAGPIAGAASIANLVNVTMATPITVTETAGVDYSTPTLVANKLKANTHFTALGWTAGGVSPIVSFTKDIVGPYLGTYGVVVNSTGADVTVDSWTAGAFNQSTATLVAEAIADADFTAAGYSVTNVTDTLHFVALEAGAKAGDPAIVADGTAITIGAVAYNGAGEHAGADAIPGTVGDVTLGDVTVTLGAADIATVGACATALAAELNTSSLIWDAEAVGAVVTATSKGEGNVTDLTVVNDTATNIFYSAVTTSAGSQPADVMASVTLAAAGIANQTILNGLFSATADQTVYVNLSNTDADVNVYTTMSKFN